MNILSYINSAIILLCYYSILIVFLWKTEIKNRITSMSKLEKILNVGAIMIGYVIMLYDLAYSTVGYSTLLENTDVRIILDVLSKSFNCDYVIISNVVYIFFYIPGILIWSIALVTLVDKVFHYNMQLWMPLLYCTVGMSINYAGLWKLSKIIIFALISTFIAYLVITVFGKKKIKQFVICGALLIVSLCCIMMFSEKVLDILLLMGIQAVATLVIGLVLKYAWYLRVVLYRIVMAITLILVVCSQVVLGKMIVFLHF